VVVHHHPGIEAVQVAGECHHVTDVAALQVGHQRLALGVETIPLVAVEQKAVEIGLEGIGTAGRLDEG
jgi:hypothetical protein